MADPGELTLERLRPLVGETFRVDAGVGRELELSLAEAKGLGEGQAPDTRAPFSLMFNGPAAPVLPQAIYGLDHAALGRTELFLVPVQADASGARYQAIFN